MAGAPNKANEGQPFSRSETAASPKLSNVLARILDSGDYKEAFAFLPVATALSRSAGDGHIIIYANQAFAKIADQSLDRLIGGRWELLSAFIGSGCGPASTHSLSHDIETFAVSTGIYRRKTNHRETVVQAQINQVQSAINGEYRLVTVMDVGAHADIVAEKAKSQIKERDMLMRELQHRVKNNLQLVTALVRLEARGAPEREAASLQRIASRVDAVSLLYRKLSAEHATSQINLGEYLDDIACAVMESSAQPDITIELDIQRFEADLNITMLIGLFVNELLTNSLKHAFKPGAGGKLRLTCRRVGRRGFVSVSDNGVGLAEGETWPPPRKLGALILQAMHDHAENITFEVDSKVGSGVQFQLDFDLR